MRLKWNEARALRALPSDVEAMLAKAMEGPALQPEAIEVAREYLREAKHLHDTGNNVAAMWACRAAWERARWLCTHASKLAQAGKKSVAASDKGNAAKTQAADSKHDDWQKRANAIWERNPTLSKSNVAGVIVKEIGGNVSTIRKAITKLA